MLNAQYVNPFIGSVYQFFKSMLACEVKRAGLNLSDGAKREGEVMALIGLSGKVRGSVALSFPDATAVAAVNRFLSTDSTEVDATVLDAIPEFVNIVAGGAKATLSEAVGATLELTLPTVLHGNDFTVYSPTSATWLEIHFSSDVGPFSLRISLQIE